MKIAFYYDLPPGGALVHTQGLLEELKKHHVVKIFTPVPPVVTGRLLRDIQAFFWSRLTAIKLARCINQEFDIAYVTHDRFFQAPWILRFLTIPVLHYSHNPTRAFFEPEFGIDRAWPLPNKIYESILRFLKKRSEIKSAKFATIVATSSRYMVNYLQNAYGISAKLAYPGVDPQIFHPLNLKKTNRAILVGNHESQKSLDLGLLALSKVPAKLRPTLAIISPRRRVGEEIKKQAVSLKVKLEIYSGLDPQEMNKLYNTSLFTLSVALREPFGLSIVESLAAGTPVVAVRQGGFVETVQEGIDGILVEREVEAIAQGITKMLSTHNNYHPTTSFTLDKSNQTILKLLSQLPRYPR